MKTIAISALILWSALTLCLCFPAEDKMDGKECEDPEYEKQVLKCYNETEFDIDMVKVATAGDFVKLAGSLCKAVNDIAECPKKHKTKCSSKEVDELSKQLFEKLYNDIKNEIPNLNEIPEVKMLCPIIGNFKSTIEDCKDDKACKCPEKTFKCTSGLCIPEDWKCDEEEDCKDGLDEATCPKPT